jgi:hypothetical protein
MGPTATNLPDGVAMRKSSPRARGASRGQRVDPKTALADRLEPIAAAATAVRIRRRAGPRSIDASQGLGASLRWPRQSSSGAHAGSSRKQTSSTRSWRDEYVVPLQARAKSSVFLRWIAGAVSRASCA